MFYMLKRVNSIAGIKITQIQKLQKTWKKANNKTKQKSLKTVWFWTAKLEYFISMCDLSVDF